MDETPCYFEMSESSTIDTKGVQTVKVKTTGHEKLRFTAVLSAGIKITANEVKAVRLPPMIIFKNLVKPPSGNFPPRVMVKGSKGDTMTGELKAKLTQIISGANDLVPIFSNQSLCSSWILQELVLVRKLLMH